MKDNNIQNGGEIRDGDEFDNTDDFDDATEIQDDDSAEEEFEDDDDGEEEFEDDDDEDEEEGEVNSKPYSLWLQLLMGAIFGVVLGLTIRLFAGTESGGTNLTDKIVKIAVVVVSLTLGIIVHLIAHEAGHFLGGLKSGYRFVSFRIFNLIFIRINGKVSLKKHDVAGTSGQCLMVPPECDANGDYPFKLYNLGGGIANLILSAVCVVLFLILNSGFKYAAFVFIPLIGVGLVYAAANLIPLKIWGPANDGNNVTVMQKDSSAKRAFYVTLLANASAAEGVRYKDMPADWSELPDDFNNPLTVSIAIIRFNRLMDSHDFAAARELAEEIVSKTDKALELYKDELRCELLFLEIIGERRQDVIDKLCTNELKKYIKANGSHLCKRRLTYAYSKLIDQNAEETAQALELLNKTFETYPYPGEMELELELVGIINNLADRLTA